ncbi:MinD/ParA family ATP-binding protein [Nocardia shimofusensis]|uniref:MinD/ParA family ATP-binding protein n=1 Tax=Nocardia shimofusensis TaxID=228596 RepID=UPI000831CB6E|nr:MinD/ParA family protein [Nocardia shimofusensis]
MTDNDHNPTSPPWLQGHSADTAEASASPTAQGEHEQAGPDSDSAERGDFSAASRPADPVEQSAPANTGGHAVAPGPDAPAPEQFDAYGSGQFAQATGPESGGFAPPPPGAPYPVPDAHAAAPNGAAPDGNGDPIYSWAPPPPPSAPMPPQQGFAPPGFAPDTAPAPPWQNGPQQFQQPQFGQAPQQFEQPPQFEQPQQPQQFDPAQQQFDQNQQFGLPGQPQPQPGPPPLGQPQPGPPPQQFGQPDQFGQQPGGPQNVGRPQQFGQPGQFGQQPAGPQGYGQMPAPGSSVNDLNLLKRARRAPRSGWRRAMHKASGGMINPGESAADIVHRDLVERVNQPVRGDYRIAILSLKGGVGKTTTTVGLGSTFASLRGDRVIAIDANPDLGTLAHRVPRQTRSTVRNLLEDQHISRYSDVRAHTSQAPSRLEVLASEQDPAVSEAFSEADYRKAINILQSFYNIILTDCGTGLMHSAMAGVLDMASSLVLVTSPAIDGARSASATLDWLEHHGYGKLVERTVVVVNASRRGASTVDLDQLRKLFLDRTRAVQVVPFDDHLAEGAEIDLELVSKPTRRALLELAAMVADDFGYTGAQHYQQQPYQYPGPPPQH